MSKSPDPRPDRRPARPDNRPATPRGTAARPSPRPAGKPARKPDGPVGPGPQPRLDRLRAKPSSKPMGRPGRKPEPRRPSKPVVPAARPLNLDFTALAPLPPSTDFTDLAAGLGIEFEPGDVERLGLYLAILLDATTTMNLTSLRDPDEAWTRHVFDSLTLLPMLGELPEGSTVLDVGSGGGLPGIPLACAMPHLKFTLLEATAKKAEFLRAAVARLALPNVAVVFDRAERLAHDRGVKTNGPAGFGRAGGHREAYDAVVARAVGRLATLAELVVPFAKVRAGDNPAGMILLIKGQAAADELAEAAPALHQLKAVHVETIDTPTGRVVILEKHSATPKLYPRRDGEPKRAPLGVGKRESRSDGAPKDGATESSSENPSES